MTGVVPEEKMPQIKHCGCIRSYYVLSNVMYVFNTLHAMNQCFNQDSRDERDDSRTEKIAAPQVVSSL